MQKQSRKRESRNPWRKGGDRQASQDNFHFIRLQFFFVLRRKKAVGS